MKVYLAWYHNGFTDSPSELLGVYASEAKAIAATQIHKANRDVFFEYKDNASWLVADVEVEA